MYLLPYVILKIIFLTSTIAEPILEILLPAENGQTLINTDQSNSANDDEKTLAQQIFEGKYGLIHKELFNDIPSRPGIVSYNINPEVPKDNINNLGGLDPDEIWLAENHLLVLRGGNFSNKKVKWSYIDNYIAPPRQVKIPENPKIPPPFPIQLEDNGPIDFVSVNDSTWNPIFFPPFPPIIGPPPPNTTFDEDDQSLFYPPKYDFVYAQENSTRVPPGPLVPGIVLPPPPNFFGPLERPEKAKKINLNTNKTIPRFNQKPYFKIPKGNHSPKESGWIPITSVKPNYIEGVKIKNNIPITTTENNYYSNTEQINYPNYQYFEENPNTKGHTTSRPEYYYEGNNKYDVEKPAQHNKYVDFGIQNQQFGFQNNYEKSTTAKPYYEYSYISPEYNTRSQIQNPTHKDNPLSENQKERPIYQGWAEKPKHTNHNNQIKKQQQHQSWSQQNNQYSDTDYDYQTEKSNVATDNPYHAFFTQDDASLVDENTKKYFALFGQKVRTEKPAQVSLQSKHHNNKNNNKVSLLGDTFVNFKQPLPAKNPESEITTTKSHSEYPQISLLDDINVNYKQPHPQINPNAETVSQNPNDFEGNYPHSFNNAAIHYNQRLPLKNIDNYNLTKKPYVQNSLQNSTPVNYKKPLQQSNKPNSEKNTQRPHLNVQPFVVRPLFDDINVNYKHPQESDNPDAEQIIQKPYVQVTQSPIYENNNYNMDTQYVTRNPSLEHLNQKPYPSQTPFYNDNIKKHKPHLSLNLNTDLITQRPYIRIPETSIFDGIRVNYKPQNQKYSNSGIVTSRPTVKVPKNQYFEDTQINYQQNSNTEEVVKRPYIKFPHFSQTDDTQLNYKKPLQLKNHDTDYFTPRPPPIHQQTPVSLTDDIQVNYKQPLPPKNIDAEYIEPPQRPLNRIVSYNLPGNSGSHFFFLTTHTGHPIQYNLRGNNYQYYKTNVK